MNIIPGIDHEKIEKHGDPSRKDYRIKHPNIKRPGGGKKGGGAGKSGGGKSGGPALLARPRGTGTRATGPGERNEKPGRRDFRSTPPTEQKGKLKGTGTKDDPIQTDDINLAAQALFQGKHVNFQQKRSVSVLLEELHRRVQEVKDKGGKAPDIDLCQVTVKGTNLFCIPAVVHRGKDKEGKERGARFFMPQLKAKPKPGSKADLLPKDKDGEVDIQPLFRDMLLKRGIKIEDGVEKASYLRPSQEYLRAEKVAGMVNSLENKRLGRTGPNMRYMDPKGDPIFVSSDNYIVDGHHRWAAIVGVDLADGKEADIDMDIMRIDMPISELLFEANSFADEYGMERMEKSRDNCGEDLFYVINTTGQYDIFDNIHKAKAVYMRQLDRGGEVYLMKKRHKHRHKGKAGCT